MSDNPCEFLEKKYFDAMEKMIMCDEIVKCHWNEAKSRDGMLFIKIENPEGYWKARADLEEARKNYLEARAEYHQCRSELG